MTVTFTPKKLAFVQLAATTADIYDSGSAIGEVHNIILCNNNTVSETVLINLDDGTYEFPIIKIILLAAETIVFQFINEGLLVDASSKLTGHATVADKVTCLVNGSERV